MFTVQCKLGAILPLNLQSLMAPVTGRFSGLTVCRAILTIGRPMLDMTAACLHDKAI
ncbi:hypothetical protein [Methylophilus sp. TWE2]|uniref:hypothetical protein n=1 Tax=Methylophilus sp. TWE2 TaxID=1662285 RepID=UPI0012E0786B|nr:hypothetical protein [Methylophilus sp. TWE2]